MTQLELNLETQSDTFYMFTANVTMMHSMQTVGWNLRCSRELTEEEEARLLQAQQQRLWLSMTYGELVSSALTKTDRAFVEATGLVPVERLRYADHEAEVLA